VADALRTEIACGQLAPGDKLPSIRKLAEKGTSPVVAHGIDHLYGTL
jgi:DNA-binding transcriptional regulator YhcF (GntR family)